MPEATVGNFDMQVAFSPPSENEDYRQRRIEVLTAWLLAQWQAERREAEHVKAAS